MSTTLNNTHALPGGSGVGSSLDAGEMARLMEAFNHAAGALQATHEALRGEVARLRRELHEANATVERSRRLAALGEMAAGIAHEVRNPLGSIRLYARMLEEDLAGQPAEAALAAKILRATRTVEGIVGDVLSFAREIKVREERVSAVVLLNAALEQVLSAGIAGAAGVAIDRDERGEAGVVVVGDVALLTQALANVMRNAIEAMHEHGTSSPCLVMRAQAARLAFSSGRRIGATVLTVQDNGPGVSPEVVERMFNPFFTTRQHGTGLGLAIVHRIIDVHGGRVVVRNNGMEARGAEVLGDERCAAETARKSDERGACVSIVLPISPEGDASDGIDVVVGRTNRRGRASRTAGARRGEQA